MANGDNGYIHLYTGDGKGKTTAAIGLAARVLGVGGRVLFCQFLKARPTGELASLRRLGAHILRAKHTSKFTYQMTPQERGEAAMRHQLTLQDMWDLASCGKYQLIVLDEVVDAVNAGFIPCEDLLQVAQNLRSYAEVVLTGRNPDASLEEIADYYTDFVCRKHPYGQGVAARKGIEY